ncbi:unnamed protein product [Didymodactylos carnosus]|uniref:Sodefrin-like factor n=1 Tax=Didymodactylos carnosus TaxID=1234261 RepID=A0A815MM12_9BILA|nr:unnamed protein product [Didymodactylos carnosus]CAF1420146.1 unnamed protein product [Didymodactylos carnosus]CAF4078289.1 unnamed protein product [Didymodactylos carnosus]CAF4303819.1 unnamed protein product [Didymodactylos carnosus]
MFHQLILTYFITIFSKSIALLTTSDYRVSTRNITCANGSNIVFSKKCEACLIVTRNYRIDTQLSLTGNGPEGSSYYCLDIKQIEGYHNNLVRECYDYPLDNLNGFNDFCIASPYTTIRGSYRACTCTIDRCNINYNECVLKNNLKIYVPFLNTIQESGAPIQCSTDQTPLCDTKDFACQNFVKQNCVLCLIKIDNLGQVTRQCLPPSLYSYYLTYTRMEECSQSTYLSKSLYLYNCQNGETICMCTKNYCDKDMDTCRTSEANKIKLTIVLLSLFSFVFIF